MKIESKRRTVLIISVCLGLIATGFYSFFQFKAAAMKPCILSLERPIRDLLSEGDFELSSESAISARKLTSLESRELVVSLVRSGKTDCGSVANISQGNDYWGNSLKIEIRSSASNSIYLKLLSVGPDGVENSDDDIGFETAITKFSSNE